MDKAWQWFKGWRPAPMAVDRFERMRACCGALLGILLTALAAGMVLGWDHHGLPLLIAPMGASAVLLFAVPASPLAQPWPVLCGNLVSAAVGVTCARLIGEPALAAAFAIALAIGLMFLLRCLHPPSGAIALTAVLGGDAIRDLGYSFLLAPVGIDSVLILLVAILFNNATGRRYPHVQPDHRGTHGTADPRPTDRLGFSPADLDDVLAKYNQVLDVSRDDLEELFLEAERHAWRRACGEITCADIMSRDVLAVEFGTALDLAWAMLRSHDIGALPVVDRARRVIGMVTLEDFLRHSELSPAASLQARLRGLLRRSGRTHSDKPEVVGQIMRAPARTAFTASHIVELVPLLSDGGLHHVPVVDEERKLAGILTQSDVVAALYHGRFKELAEAA